jgi:hypothetical protein
VSRDFSSAPLSSSKSFTAPAVSQHTNPAFQPRSRDTQLTKDFGPESQTQTESQHMTSPDLDGYKGSRLVERIREVLHGQARYLTSHSIALVIREYEKRRDRYSA